jgi:hypothetical protein
MALFEAYERFRGQKVDRRHYLRFVASLLFLSLYLSWRDAKVQAKPVDSPPQKFDVADYEGRAKLDQTTKDLTNKLGDAEAKITTLEETIRQQNNKLEVNENALAALPEEAKRDFKQLLEQLQLARTITPEQRTKSKAEIEGKPAPRLLGQEVPKPEIAICHIGDDEAYNFALQIRELLKECGFKTSDVPYDTHGLRLDVEDEKLGTVSSRPPGILLSLADQKYQSPWSNRIHRALTILNNGEVKVFPMKDSVAKRFGQAEVIVIVGKKP